MNYGSYGLGTTAHLAMEEFCDRAGATVTHIPYLGAAATMTALMANQIDAALADTETALPRATASNGALKVFGRYPVGGDVAILFPKGSKNVAPTDEILADMRADGSLEGIEVKWLAPILGAPVSTIAQWSTE
mgnify:CR=1 FL=1